ncbi:TRAP-type C4-dicarboxylate transport system permease small subunit [Paraburkholderia kururiensis]|uniref:hypothetical protein n=1 Tax=Paraburkholderia kururiensis TaxID=984307 RepID=UPI0039A5A3BA
MKIWLALLAAPAAVLGAQSIDYALVHVACRWQSAWPLHLVSAAAFVFSTGVTVLAWRRWRAEAKRVGTPLPASYGALIARPGFFAFMAMVLGAFSALIQLMMWFPQTVLPLCA